jgi:hypothetical protein
VKHFRNTPLLLLTLALLAPCVVSADQDQEDKQPPANTVEETETETKT